MQVVLMTFPAIIFPGIKDYQDGEIWECRGAGTGSARPEGGSECPQSAAARDDIGGRLPGRGQVGVRLRDRWRAPHRPHAPVQHQDGHVHGQG